MAHERQHLSWSTFLGLGYAGAGMIVLHVQPEHAILAAFVVLLAGNLPNIDAGDGSGFPGELLSFMAALSPLALFSYFPELRTAGFSRLALVLPVTFFAAKYLISSVIKLCMEHRGILHSIPAAVITAEVVYLLFDDLSKPVRLFLAVGALFGFISHLVMDATGNLPIFKGDKKPAALKFFGQSSAHTMIMYLSIVVLGYFIVADFYPALGTVMTGLKRSIG